VNRQAFGRRNQPQPRSEPPAAAIVAPIAEPAPRPQVPPPRTDAADEDLRAWKETRRLRFPLQQFSLMASLCFGIASFALPESLNDSLQWPLYGLAAASLYVGLSKRFRKSDAKGA